VITAPAGPAVRRVEAITFPALIAAVAAGFAVAERWAWATSFAALALLTVIVAVTRPAARGLDAEYERRAAIGEPENP
jgi:hypothetical protein